MGVYQAIRASNGVRGWLNKNNFDLGKPKKKSYRALDEHFNSILIKFGKENNIKMERNNSPGYKGDYNPSLSNCITIQNNWNVFTKWIKDNYPKKQQ